PMRATLCQYERPKSLNAAESAWPGRCTVTSENDGLEVLWLGLGDSPTVTPGSACQAGNRPSAENWPESRPWAMVTVDRCLVRTDRLSLFTVLAFLTSRMRSNSRNTTSRPRP